MSVSPTSVRLGTIKRTVLRTGIRLPRLASKRSLAKSPSSSDSRRQAQPVAMKPSFSTMVVECSWGPVYIRPRGR